MPRHMGMDLKVRRIRARLGQREVAETMHVSRVRVAQIEGDAELSTVVRERYLTGLTRAVWKKKAEDAAK